MWLSGALNGQVCVAEVCKFEVHYRNRINNGEDLIRRIWKKKNGKFKLGIKMLLDTLQPHWTCEKSSHTEPSEMAAENLPNAPPKDSFLMVRYGLYEFWLQ